MICPLKIIKLIRFVMVSFLNRTGHPPPPIFLIPCGLLELRQFKKTDYCTQSRQGRYLVISALCATSSSGSRQSCVNNWYSSSIMSTSKCHTVNVSICMTGTQCRTAVNTHNFPGPLHRQPPSFEHKLALPRILTKTIRRLKGVATSCFASFTQLWEVLHIEGPPEHFLDSPCIEPNRLLMCSVTSHTSDV